MSFTQKLGLFIFILITCVYVYFSFFSNEDFKFDFNRNKELEPIEDFRPQDIEPLEEITKEQQEVQGVKTVKIFVYDTNGNMRSVSRKCDTNKEKSCFAFAIKELVLAPTKYEKSKGIVSEIPSSTKIISVREGNSNIMIDLNSSFESGGGSDTIYRRLKQLIKTANTNTTLPVYLYINGKQVDVIGGDGVMIKQPLNERSLDE